MDVSIVENVIGRIFGKAAIEQSTERREAEADHTRKALVGARNAAIRAKDDELLRLAPIGAKIEAEFEKQNALYQSAVAKRLNHQRVVSTVKHEATIALDRIDSRLRSIPNPLILAVESRLAARVATMRKDGAHVVDATPPGFSIKTQTRSNLHAFRPILAAVQVARHQLDLLRFAGDDDIAGAIATIEAAIPWSQLEVLELDGGPLEAA